MNVCIYGGRYVPGDWVSTSPLSFVVCRVLARLQKKCRVMANTVAAILIVIKLSYLSYITRNNYNYNNNSNSCTCICVRALRREDKGVRERDVMGGGCLAGPERILCPGYSSSLPRSYFCIVSSMLPV